jgi:hypothetical protein
MLVRTSFEGLGAYELSYLVRVKHFLHLDMILSTQFDEEDLPVTIDYLNAFLEFLQFYFGLFPNYFSDVGEMIRSFHLKTSPSRTFRTPNSSSWTSEWPSQVVSPSSMNHSANFSAAFGASSKQRTLTFMLGEASIHHIIRKTTGHCNLSSRRSSLLYCRSSLKNPTSTIGTSTQKHSIS